MSSSDTIQTLEQAASWLEGLINLERDPRDRRVRVGLEAIQALLARIGHPERALSVVHVAGSKGKGSVCLIAEAILGELGERVGSFTSPHLERWTERFRIAGEEVEGGRLAAVVDRLRPHVELLRELDDGRSPTFFDATTAAAFELFAGAALDRALIEVGLGGRLDSTNVVAPAVTCITSIEREHTDRLGNTLAAIAGEKAGILKAGVPCVVGPLAPEALERVEARANELGAPLARLGEEFDVRIDPGGGPSGEQVLHYSEAAGFELVAALALLGEHQATNAALALACVRRLAAHDDAAVARAARCAFARAVLPGRCEVVQREPWIVIDSAHTVASAEVLAAVLAGIPGKPRHLVLSLSADKDLAAILPVLIATADEVTLTRADRNRSTPPDELAKAVRELDARIETRIVEDPAQALRSARAALAADGRLCAAGSFYLAGIARRVLGAG